MRIFGKFLSGMLLTCCALTAQLWSAEYDLGVKEHIFDNGLRLLVIEQPENHRVACKIFTDMGAFNETVGDLGSAHYLEHLMFKGTPTLGSRDWTKEKPFIDQITTTEKALIAAQNKARNALTQRGVFLEYQHAESTPEIDSLRAEIDRLNRESAHLRKNGEMMRWYQGFGGEKLTATTEQEYMKFDINLPKERVAVFLRVEADRMRNTVFREFDQERMILVEQRYGDLNRLTTPYYEAMNAMVQTVHPVYWPEGWLSDFYQYTREYERNLFETFFVPNNTTLIFIGGVTMEQMVRLTEHYFGWMERAPEPPFVKAIEPKPLAEKRLVWRSEKLAPRVEIRFKIPAIGHPERPHFDVFGEALSQTLSASLKKAGVFGSVNVNTRVVHTARFGVPGTMNAEVVLQNENDLEKTERVMLETFEALKKTPVKKDVLDYAKKKLRVAWRRTAQDPDRLAFEIGHFQTMDHWTTLEKHLSLREKTSADNIQSLAKKYLIAENRNVGVVRKPEGGQ